MKKAVLAIAVQFIALALLAFGTFVLKPIPWLHKLLLYVLMPAAGAVSAFIIVRKGVNPYLAWTMPPLALTVAGYASSMGYLPEGGAMLLTAFVSVVGAAAGDTCNKFMHKDRR